MSIDVDAIKPEVAELCREYGVEELMLFGSVARGEDRLDSDVDVLYVRSPGNRLGLAFLEFREELERLFNAAVDLVPKEGLHWVIRDRILAEARVLYAAA